ncbi:MAG: hypothetical protein IPJ84_14010 [Bdellovibrionales bacterium]|nr:hypothetical protein [Bdellovibrionales bacterium]
MNPKQTLFRVSRDNLMAKEVLSSKPADRVALSEELNKADHILLRSKLRSLRPIIKGVTYSTTSDATSIRRVASELKVNRLETFRRISHPSFGFIFEIAEESTVEGFKKKVTSKWRVLVFDVSKKAAILRLRQAMPRLTRHLNPDGRVVTNRRRAPILLDYAGQIDGANALPGAFILSLE